MKQPPGAQDGGQWRPVWAYGLVAGAILGGAAWLLSDTAADAPSGAPGPTELAAAASIASHAGSAATLANAASAQAPVASLAPSAAAVPLPTSPPTPAPRNDDLAAHVPSGVVPTMNEVIERLHQAGVRTGLGAFNPPGTKPVLLGLAVPEDFALPPGYLRHHQATDDGQRIEAILMFDAEQPPAAAAGRALATPADRVVPAELAPAGLPIRQIVLPAPAEAGSTRR